MNLTNEDRHKVVHEFFSDMIQEKIEEISKGVISKEKPVSEAPKTFFVNPYDFYASSQGQWRERPSQITWETCKAISKKSPVISSIIKTRTGQVGTFSAPISLMELCGNSTIGYTFIPLDKDKKISKSEERMIKELEQFIWNCGVDAENHKFNRDNFDIWLKKITRDSLVYDAACSEILPTRRGSIYEFHAIDAATVRQASVIDNKVHNEAEEENPVYVQVLNGQVVAEYMHDEIMYGVRNPTTDIRNCGYGESEIELLISVVTSLMNAMTHNAMFFKNGAAIKGLLNIKNSGPLGEVANQQLEAFKRAFHAMCNGSTNAWRTPITSAEGVEFISMSNNNREMEFSRYLDFLVKMVCFPAGTQITMSDGTRKNIEDIQVGDEVITHLGRVKKVTNTNSRHHSGDMVKINGPCGIGIVSTPNHPYFVVPTEVSREKLRVIKSRKFLQPEWKKAVSIRNETSTIGKIPYVGGGCSYFDDNLFAPKIDFQDKEWVIKVRKSNGDKPGNIKRDEITVDKDLARFLGVYVAEGWSDPISSAITLSFGSNEQQLLTYCRDVFKSHFGLETTVRDFSHRGCYQIIARSRMLAEWLIETFGSLAINKKLPDEVFCLRRELRLSFIKGMIDGDGALSNNGGYVTCASLTTASLKLAEQFQILALSCVGPTYLQTCIRNSGFLVGSSFYRVVFTKQQLHYFTDLFGHKGENARIAVSDIDGRVSSPKRSFYELENGYALQQKKEPEIIHDFSGQVYNIEVDEDQSYLVNGIVSVHNCSIYQIDPSEIGFWMTAGNSDRAPMFESNQEAKLKMSKDKGLRPLLTAIARWVNYYIVSKVAPGFYFTFVGMDAKSEGEILEARLKELKGYKMLDEIREEAGLKPLGDEKGGDLILDPTYVQALQQRAMLKMQQDQMAQGQDQGQEGQDQGGEEWALPEGGDQDQQSQDENQQDQGEDQQGEAQQGDENQKFWQQMQGGEDQEGGQEDDQGEQPWHKYLQSPDEQGEEQGQKKEKPLKKSLAIEDFSDDKLIEIYLEG